MINRRCITAIEDALECYPIVSLTGPRQSGKTTVLKTAFSNYRYVSLEDPDMRLFARTDCRRFLEVYDKYVIIDEAQHVPELFSYLQTKVDSDGVMGQYILSGSQNFLLMHSISQSLAGRVAIFKLLPFSIFELKAADKLPSLDELLLKGAYPRLYDVQLDSKSWYEDYIQTYIERDVRQLKNISNLNQFRSFLRICATRVGQVFSYSSAARDLGVSHNTVKEWISVLEASYIVYRLPAYTSQLSKRENKSPKLYFYDHGLAAALLGISDIETFYLSEYAGALFECMIVNEFVKNAYHQKHSFNGYFWRERDRYEIDLLIEKGGNVYTFEIKLSKTVKRDFFKNLAYFTELSTSQKKIMKYVVYGAELTQSRSGGEILSWKSDFSEFI